MTDAIDSIGKAARRDMVVRAECPRCGNARNYRARDLVVAFGAERNLGSLRFRCSHCTPPQAQVRLVAVDRDHGTRMVVWRPFIEGGRLVDWYSERLK